MKTCNVCSEEKDLSQFYRTKRNKDGYQARCKKCANEACAASEQKNREKYGKIRQRSSAKLRDEMRKYKAERGCAHCDESDPIVLELHHPDPTVKDLHPSDAHSRKMFYEEASKCWVLCANCHRKEHYRLRQSLTDE